MTDQTNLFGASFGTSRRYWSVVLADFDGNGLSDLHAAIDLDHDFHCRQSEVGAFTDVSAAAGVSNIGSDMGLAIGDIENDGDLDIYSTNINIQVLYVNNGNGVFTDQATSRGVRDNGNLIGFSWAWGTTFADFDHDRDLDLIYLAVLKPGALFQNNGNGYFTNITSNGGVYPWGYGLAPFDFDRDGDLDLLITDTDLHPALYENVSPSLTGNHYLGIDLIGRASNRDGVGAKLSVTASGVTMIREMLGGYSYVSGPPIEEHFGLGSTTVADSLTVRWPSGISQTFFNVAADQLISIVEGDLDADQQVNLTDYAILQQCAGTIANPISLTCPAGRDADLDDDGDVDVEDFELFATTLPTN